MNLELKGKTLKDIKVIKNHPYELDTIYFLTTDNELYCMRHSQDCCEEVYIDDIVGDINDLVGSPILEASVQTSETKPTDGRSYDEAYLWTFYKFKTRKGYVDLKWFGTSNGWYSVEVSFYKIDPGINSYFNCDKHKEIIEEYFSEHEKEK